MSVVPLVLMAAPDDEDVVAGWTAFAIFGLLILAVVILGFSLVKRLKNVDRAAEAGLYDPSDRREKPARGLAAARQMREQAAAEDAGDHGDSGDSRP
jgi:hypothetical protein